MNRLVVTTLLLTLVSASANAQSCSGQFASGNICGNDGASQALPGQKSLSSLTDRNFGSAQGTVPNRGATDWSATASPVLGKPATLAGTLGIANGGAGGATITISNPTATAAYNFNLPASAGASGAPLLSGGGGSTAMSFSTLGIAHGGTNNTAFSAGSVIFADSTKLTEDNTSFFYDSVDKRLGVKTNTPQQPLDVMGAIRNSAGVNPLDLLNSGTVQTWDANGSDISLYSGASRLYIVESTGFVGVKTTSPQTQLDVQGTIRNSNGTNPLDLLNTGTTQKWDANGSDIDFYTGADRLFIQNSTGRVGVNTISPGAQLDVNGTIRNSAGSHALDLTSSLAVQTWNANGSDIDLFTGVDMVYIKNSNGRVGIKTTSPGQDLDVKGNIRSSGGTNALDFVNAGTLQRWDANGSDIDFYSGGDRLFIRASDGNVGINNASPGASYKLDVTGNTHSEGSITLGTAGTTAGSVVLSGATSGTATIRVAAAAGTGTIFQLPADNGTNNFILKTDGTGVTSWTAVGSGTVTSVACGTGLNCSASPITTTGTISLTAARQTLPTTQRLTSGTDATYTTPANTLWIEVWMTGGGGGGGAQSTNAGADGTDSCWKASGTACTSPIYAATHGSGGGVAGTNPGAGGGTAGSSACNDSFVGADGSYNAADSAAAGGNGGNSWRNGSGKGGPAGGNASDAKTNSGSGGGGGGGSAGSVLGGSGGGGAGTCHFIIDSPAASYAYTVGGGGGGGSAGGTAGGHGGDGLIFVVEHYGS